MTGERTGAGSSSHSGTGLISSGAGFATGEKTDTVTGDNLQLFKHIYSRPCYTGEEHLASYWALLEFTLCSKQDGTNHYTLYLLVMIFLNSLGQLPLKRHLKEKLKEGKVCR